MTDVSPIEGDAAPELPAHLWPATADLRETLADADGPLTYPQLCAELNGAPPTRRQGRPVAIDPPDAAGLRIADKLPLLRQAGLVERVRGGYVLTAEGVRTARWAGIPKPDDRPERGAGSHAAELARVCAKSAGVTVHELVRGDTGRARMARRRLCRALRARGWEAGAI